MNRRISDQIHTQIIDSQHGFKAGKSTVTNHINFVDYVATGMDSKRQVDAAYFDFKKAFDRVHNDVLLKKFAEIGFTPRLLQLFASYFSNRVQYVQLDGCRSYLYLTCSGVSQGSTLGPTQFLIMINDLPRVVRTAECLMFADDLKLYFAIGGVEDCESLQSDINSVVEWGKRNHLEFNRSKCKTISFTRSLRPISFDYHMSGVILERVTEIRDLGVTLDVELTFNTHIIDVCNRAFKSLGFVMRQAARFNDRSAIIVLFYAYVRSKLEYNSIIWDPHERTYMIMLERVQRKFARYLYKRLYGYYPFLYPSLFVSGMVGIDTLILRRKCALLFHFYQLLNGRIDNPSALARWSLAVPDRARESRACSVRRLFARPSVRTLTSEFAPTSQAVSLLNGLLAQESELDVFYCKPNEFYNRCTNLLSKLTVTILYSQSNCCWLAARVGEHCKCSKQFIL